MNILLKGSIKERDVPIKIDGYIKKEFELNVDVIRREKSLGTFIINFKTSGRNWGQLKERAAYIYEQ